MELSWYRRELIGDHGCVELGLSEKMIQMVRIKQHKKEDTSSQRRMCQHSPETTATLQLPAHFCTICCESA